MINLGVIGATGSVGSSIMSVCEAWPDKICVKALAEKFSVKKVYAYEQSGEHGLEEIACDSEIEHVAFVSSGTSAIKALCSALKAGKTISLANKESIVAAGKWVMPLVKHDLQVRPVDSE
ncbi:MAG: 1-deoxy-D-xylulose-5-phosphate reductoisomerase, partial [Synergistaceae bacterium]|nr:1-deoxy-D-xylulose-5-phosphate reductoisomerase [Synergistaceae bacterium]